jgi:hypothetical protein
MTDANEAAARQRLTEDKEARAKQHEHHDKLAKGKPTPTQDENDMAALGAPVREKDDDGSGPDPNVEADKKRAEEAKAAHEKRRKEIEAGKPAGGGYQTRQSTPAKPHQRSE